MRLTLRSLWLSGKKSVLAASTILLLLTGGVGRAQAEYSTSTYGPFSVPWGSWFSTGIKVKKGDSFSVRATGAYRPVDQSTDVKTCGPDGCGHWQWFVLKAKVGSQMTDVKSFGHMFVDQDGVIELGSPRTTQFAKEDAGACTGTLSVEIDMMRTEPPLPASKPRDRCPDGKPGARIESIAGDVSFRTTKGDWADISVGMHLCMDDEIGTGPESEVHLVFDRLPGQGPGDHAVVVRQLTQIVIGTMRGESTCPRLQVLLKAGEIVEKLTGGHYQQKAVEGDFSVRTPVATCSVRGTTFSVRHDQKGGVTTVTVQEGHVRVTPANTSLRYVDLRAGQQVKVTEQNISAVSSVRTGTTGLDGKNGSGGSRYIGCFRDAELRALDGANWQDGGMTTERCLAFCAQKGFPYAGTQYATWCFCGNSYDQYGTNGATCNMQCGGNNAQTCGGGWANSVYEVQVTEQNISRRNGSSSSRIDVTPVAGSTDVTGNWYREGDRNHPASVSIRGGVMYFTNEFGQTSRGHFENSYTVVADDWEGGLRGDMTRDRRKISWRNGSTWSRIDVAPLAGSTDVTGTWYREGDFNRPASISIRDGVIYFTNEFGQTSRGHFENSYTVVADDWEGGLRGDMTRDRRKISWRNGSSWSRIDADMSSSTGSISVLAGTYGANCGTEYGNKTKHLATACNGEKRCEYKIDYMVIGDPAVGCAKEYIAEWQCGSAPAKSTKAAAEAGFGSVISLTCP